MGPRATDDRVDNLEDDVVQVRERLARVETSMQAHESAAAERHRELLAVVHEVKAKQEAADQRAWKITMALLGVGIFGGAGVAEWVRALI